MDQDDTPKESAELVPESSPPESPRSPEGAETSGPELAQDEESDEQPAESPSDVFPFEPITPAPDRALMDAVSRVGEMLSTRLEQVENLLKREGRAEAAREKVIDRLHSELQDYKQDLLLSTLRPVFVDLIQLHDDIGKMAVVPDEARGDGLAEATATRLVDLMEGFRQGIEDILYRQGVEPFAVDGDTFDPRQQRAVATVATDDPALNKTVAARHRKGFRAGDRVIRAEIVSVYAVKKGAP